MTDMLISKTGYHNVIHILTTVLLLLAGLLPAGPIQAQAQAQQSTPRLTSDSDIAAAGFFRLTWQTDAERVELQEATNPAFKNPTTPYIGPDHAAVVSGKPNGTLFYRVRALSNSQSGPWSEPVTVVVDHHDLSRALMFLTLGIIVFLAIVLVIVRGARKMNECR